MISYLYDGKDFSLRVYKYYNNQYRYYRMREHTHKAFEIMYIAEGKCKVSVYSEKTEDYTVLSLSKGMYIYIYSGVIHNLYIDRDSVCRIYNIEIETADPNTGIAISSLPSSEDITQFINDRRSYLVKYDDGTMFTVLSCAINLLASGYDYSCVQIQLALYNILLCLASHNRLESTVTTSSEKYIIQCEKYIREHFDTSELISLEAIASHLNISKGYLQRLFGAYKNTTITDYINSLRIEKALYLLSATELSVFDIALDSGFGTRQRMNQLFHERIGISPAEYRKKCRNAEFDYT